MIVVKSLLTVTSNLDYGSGGETILSLVTASLIALMSVFLAKMSVSHFVKIKIRFKSILSV